MNKTTRTSSLATSRKAERLVAARRKELAALDDEFFPEVVGVAQAIDALRKALSKLSSALDACQRASKPAAGWAARRSSPELRGLKTRFARPEMAGNWA